ncbi:helicase-related protein [Salinibacterium sp. ZJ450]|uniref:helicase-related protein n=1 Tax=Salinibacterium sp. ZJ450 TaxID=2708338 RepID=UPI00141DEABD|nr:helicase-related protein [Salinibacterium sp. ZJ450]
MTGFDADAILAELKSFQLDAVEHVIDRLYDAPDSTRRFLVADETGLGKSVIARGVIARAIERLEADDTVDRIDIVYVCSNADLASQNLRRLNVTGNPHLGFTSRLTLLARESGRLAQLGSTGGKTVNLVSFTPGTSFDMGSSRTGSADERALLHVMLTEIFDLNIKRQRASRMLLQGPVRTASAFAGRVDRTRRQLGGPVDPAILESFRRGLIDSRMAETYTKLLDDLAGRRKVPEERTHDVRQLTGRLRAGLARASVETLEPDLVILDEFQRFRHLLDLENGGDAAELAHHLFDYPSAKVLLLSATPYKPYTAASSDADEDHYSDFMTTLSFLAGDAPEVVDDIRASFAEFRTRVVNGSSASHVVDRLRASLLRLMSRTERPQLESHDAVVERLLPSAPPTADDLLGFTALERLAGDLGVPIGMEYWKSVPYFASFMDNYQVARALDDRRATGDRLPSMASLQRLDADALRAYAPLDFGNSHLRALANETLDRGLWKLLWMPPSMPYLQPGSVFAPLSDGSATKRVVFSSWTATPTAISSLLSYEAERRIVEGSRLTVNSAEARKSIASRLDYKVVDDRPRSMSTLALFWPHPGLAAVADPLRLARASGDSIVTAQEAEELVKRELAPGQTTDAAWQSFFGTGGAVPRGMPLDAPTLALNLSARTGELTDDEDVVSAGSQLSKHVAHAIATIAGANSGGTHPELARIALHSPGNIAFRALGRVRTAMDATTAAGHWRAAALLSNGLRSLFNRLESTLLLDGVTASGSGEESYWQAVLDYCADGNLQAVLDEYIFQLQSETPGSELNDELLMTIASRAVDAVTLRPSTYHARDLDNPGERIPFTARFALRYGGKTQDEESARQPEIRNAFNSPFWPFVLASTSVGQEGIDFHWWSHAVLHWNVPSNPVDFEQREGRVNRFAGHAVRKNVATEQRAAVMASSAADPWRAAFDAADDAHPEFGDFSPFWVYPGAARIERQLVSFPLSKDLRKIERLKEALSLYRLTLGQPRQEDMLEILRRRGIDSETVPTLDLRPPRRGQERDELIA